MARTLNVYYDRELVGQLVQDNGWQMTFQYDASWLGRVEPILLSLSLPLRDEPFTQKECQSFFWRGSAGGGQSQGHCAHSWHQ